MLYLGFGDEIRLILIKAVNISVDTLVQRGETSIFTISTHILVEAALLENEIESTQLRPFTQQLSNGLIVSREKVRTIRLLGAGCEAYHAKNPQH
jgi:hypothetical protein